MVEASTVKSRRPRATRAHAGHNNKPEINPVPSPFEFACQLLEPPIAQRVLGRRKAILAFFENRYTWGAVKHWAKGRRQAPQWAIDRIIAELRKTAADRMAAADMLEKEKGRG